VDIVQGILSTAQAIGANPLDLATVISYETGGTFDPLQTGPTTQWGQHRGLIQFGEPQAQQYGVDWNDPLGSQLGPNGAVANYLRGSGYQPGMGLLDLYSTINAGAPGRYGATDANNGGAPGTVADKVNEQMAGHRANAERLLGQQMAATPLAAGHNQPQGLLGTVSTSGAPERQPGIFDALLGKLPAPVASRLGSADWRDNMTLALAGMSMNPNQALIGGVQRRMDNRDEQRRLNESMQWLAGQPGGEQYAGAIAAGMDPSQVFAAYVQSQQQPPANLSVTDGGLVLNMNDGSVVADYRSADPADATAAIQNFEYLRAQGVPDAEAIDRAFGSNAPTVNTTVNNGGENAFSAETGKILAQEAAAVVDAGAVAQRNLGLIDNLESALSTAPQGAAGALTMWAGRLGIPTDGLADAQVADAIISQLVPQQRPPGTGTMSDADLALFKQSLPQIINTPEGNAKIIETMRAISQYDIARADIARKLQLGQITATDAAAAYSALGNPLANWASGGTTEAPALSPDLQSLLDKYAPVN
jgi:hypothetical protein